MFSRYVAVILSVCGIISATLLVAKMATPVPPSEICQQPAKNPYGKAISGSGIIEAVHENVAVGPHESGIIDRVYKEVGQHVKKGEPLLALDTTQLHAEQKIKQAKVDVSKARLARLQDQYDRLKSIQDARAISINELKTKENDVLIAESELRETMADLNWVETRIERMTLVAPQDGVIIQKRAKVGEYLSPMGRDPSFLIGDLSELQIRADIDEQNASWFIPGTKAVAFPKNRPDKVIPLKFVRIEPYIIPKKSLTGMGDERVDTRVLQVIYTIEPPKEFTLYVGQQVDVFIEAESER